MSERVLAQRVRDSFFKGQVKGRALIKFIQSAEAGAAVSTGFQNSGFRDIDRRELMVQHSLSAGKSPIAARVQGPGSGTP